MDRRETARQWVADYDVQGDDRDMIAAFLAGAARAEQDYACLLGRNCQFREPVQLQYRYRTQLRSDGEWPR